MTFLLTKIFLKSSIQKMNEQYGVSSNKVKKLKIMLYAFLALYIIGIIYIFSYNIIDGLREINQETTFIGLILLIVLGFTAVQTIFSSINILYFTKDTDSLLPLPIKPYQIIWARTNVLILVEYFIDIIIGLIPLIIYGIMLNCGTMYYVSAVLAVLLLPILPIILISLIVMVVMSFSKITKNKNRFQLIATLLVLALVIAFSFGITQLDSTEMTDEQMIQMITQANSMVNMIKGYFPTLEFGINAVTSTSVITTVIEFAKLIGITVIAFAIYILLAQKLYFKGLIGNLYGGSKKKSFNSEIKSKRTTLGRVYVAKEFKTLLRNPVYLVQCILPAIIFPVLCIGIVVFGFNGDEAQDLAELSAMLQEHKLLLLFGIIAINQFFSMIIYVSATAISRDGENAVFMKYIPVSLYKQYVYKTTPNIIMNIISILIVLGLARYAVEISVLDLVIAFGVSTIMAVFQSFLLLLIDLKRPKLKWSSEYAVVKQNFNLIFPMIFSFVNIGIIVILGLAMEEYPAYIPVAILAVAFMLATVILCGYLKKNQYKLASKIM